MLKQAYDFAKRLISLSQETQRNKDEIKEVRQELKQVSKELRELTEVVQRLAFELQRTRENEAHEREKMALRLELTLSRFERRLPPGNASEGESKEQRPRCLLRYAFLVIQARTFFGASFRC